MKIHTIVLGHKSRNVVMAGALVCALGTAAAAEDFAYHAIDEIPEGQGLVTDESGEFTIFKWSRDRSNDTTTRNTTSTQSAPAQTITSTSGITEAPTPE